MKSVTCEYVSNSLLTVQITDKTIHCQSNSKYILTTYSRKQTERISIWQWTHKFNELENFPLSCFRISVIKKSNQFEEKRRSLNRPFCSFDYRTVTNFIGISSIWSKRLRKTFAFTTRRGGGRGKKNISSIRFETFNFFTEREAKPARARNSSGYFFSLCLSVLFHSISLKLQ